MEDGVLANRTPPRAEPSASNFPALRHFLAYAMSCTLLLLLFVPSLVGVLTLHPPTTAHASLPPPAVGDLSSHLAAALLLPRGPYRTSGYTASPGAFRAAPLGPSPRRRAVRDATRGAWDAYAARAWAFDELKPVSGTGTNSFAEGLGTMIVDSLSTLYIMGGLDGRYARARAWVADELDFSKVGNVIVFETVIRILGGLVSMYHLSGDEMYAAKAEELGLRLGEAFDTVHGFPWPRCYLNQTGRCEGHDGSDVLYLAEVGTVQLEFRALAHLSRSEALGEVRRRTEAVVASLQEIGSSAHRFQGRYHSLLPFAISMSRGTFSTSLVTFGAPADSYFEYLVKMWVQGGRKEERYWQLFAQIADSMVDLFTGLTDDGDVVLQDLNPESDGSYKTSHKQDHFTCFIPGALVLGLDGVDSSTPKGRWRLKAWEKLAADITATCYKMYSSSPSGLSGEHIRVTSGGKMRQSGGYKLRPEALEAMFYMYRHTKDQKYRDWAWAIFEAMEKWCKNAEGAFSPLRNPRSKKPMREDSVQPSFLVSETFKYLYLIFGDDPDELPLSLWVFNTEAHPLLVSPGIVTPESIEKLLSLRIESDWDQFAEKSVKRYGPIMESEESEESEGSEDAKSCSALSSSVDGQCGVK